MPAQEKGAPGRPRATRDGFLYGTAAYGMWGMLAMFWPLLGSSNPTEILAHRMVWSLPVALIILILRRRWSWLRPLLRAPRRLALSAAAAVTISVNWGLYIWGVNSDHVVEASLGSFITPLAVIAAGVVVYKERLRRGQWAAVGVGTAAVVVLSFCCGRLPWLALALALAVTFAAYGVLKKKAGLDGIESFAVESAFLFPVALGYLIYLQCTGHGTFGHGTGHSALLALSGLVTAIPMLCFGAAAIRLPLSSIGLLQYLAPVMEFVLGVAYFREPMRPAQWGGFVLVWGALTLLTWEALRQTRTRSLVRVSAAEAKP
ncbi:EamA family transporter RarD, partial [Kitasatospora mediocidica]|uniref:EamA family transporter RarD n=1 Tax=Kitasatospora mediocidica TaxID=58352 RepID=UPI00055EB945